MDAQCTFTKDQQDWYSIAEVLDALSTAADIAVFAEQQNNVAHVLRAPADCLAATTFRKQLSTALPHAITSGLHLVQQLDPQHVQQMPFAAAHCLFSCMEAYCKVINAFEGQDQEVALQMQQDLLESGLLTAIAALAPVLKASVVNSSPSLPPTTAAHSQAKAGSAAAAADTTAALDQQRTLTSSLPLAGHNPMQSTARPSHSRPTAAAALIDTSTATAAQQTPEASISQPAAAAAAAAPVALHPINPISQGLLGLSTELLDCIKRCPTLPLLGQQLLDAVLALSGLAVSILQCDTCAVAAAIGTLDADSSSRQLLTPALLMLIWNYLEAVTWAFRHGLVPLASGMSKEQLMMSDNVLMLTLWMAANAVSITHRQPFSVPTAIAEAAAESAAGFSSRTLPTPQQRQQQQAEGHHNSLFDALGFPAATPSGGASELQNVLTDSLMLLLSCVLYRSSRIPAVPAALFNTMNPSSGLHPCKVLNPELTAPCMLTMISVLLSQQEDSVLYSKSAALILLLGDLLWHQAGSLGLSSRTVGIPTAAYVSIVRPMICELLPHMQQLLQVPAMSAAEPRPALVQKGMLDMLIKILHIAGTTPSFTDAVFQELGAVFTEQPHLTAAAVESALRSEAVWQPVQLADTAVLLVSTRLLLRVIGTTSYVIEGSSVKPNSAAAPEGAAVSPLVSINLPTGLVQAAATFPQVASGLVSLLTTCLKCVMTSKDEENRVGVAVGVAAAAVALSGVDDMGVLEYFDFAEDDVRYVINIVPDKACTGQALPDPGSSSNTAAAVRSAAALASFRPWLVLVGRSLYVLGKLCRSSYWQQKAAAAGSQALFQLAPIMTATFLCENLVQWLGRHIPQVAVQDGSPVAAAAAGGQGLENLMRQQQQLLGSLCNISHKLGPMFNQGTSEDAMMVCVRDFISTVAAQVQQFGASVCAELPVRGCCGNLECMNMKECSEVQLASQGFRCSSCKVVRYCGVDCQHKHWKQHKPVCARIEASR